MSSTDPTRGSRVTRAAVRQSARQEDPEEDTLLEEVEWLTKRTKIIGPMEHRTLREKRAVITLTDEDRRIIAAEEEESEYAPSEED